MPYKDRKRREKRKEQQRSAFESKSPSQDYQVTPDPTAIQFCNEDVPDFGHAGSSGNVFNVSQLGLSVSSMGVDPSSSLGSSVSSMGVGPSSSFSSSRGLVRSGSISFQTINKIPRLEDSNICFVDDDSYTSSIISYRSSRGLGRPKNIHKVGRPRKISNFTSDNASYNNYISENLVEDNAVLFHESDSDSSVSLSFCSSRGKDHPEDQAGRGVDRPKNITDHIIPDEGVIVNEQPVLFLAPDPPIRRSERIRYRSSIIPSPIMQDMPSCILKNPIRNRCTLRHKEFPCADVRANHTAEYYDSGTFGSSAVCYYCKALLLESEVNLNHKYKFKVVSSSHCCRCGKVTLPPYNEHPQILKDLLKGDTKISKEFLANENVYNSLLAFGSISVGHKDASLDGATSFLLNGEFVRRISSMFSGNLTPSFSQLYILDANDALELRTNDSKYGGDRVNPQTLKKLDALLRAIHPFALEYKNFHSQYQTILERDGPDAVRKFRFTLLEERSVPYPIKDKSAHPRQVNLPYEKSLFSVWTESDEPPQVKGVFITDLQGSLFEVIVLLTMKLMMPLTGGGLSQKITLDYAARIDADVANYLRKPELNLRSTVAPDFLNHIAKGGNIDNVEDITSVVLFRKKNPGTRPYFQDMFYDATTIMARTRKPNCASFMLTFTTNPRWPEISRNFLHKGQKLVDRFDVICRIYTDKMKKLHNLLDKKHIFGKILGYAESMEFQKRIGGPHLHRVFTIDREATAENIENLIWAHIPPEPPASDKSDWANFLRKIRELLPKFQLHDCSDHCRGTNGRCMKGFPKPYSRQTILHDDKPAEYKRPSPKDGGEVLKIKRDSIEIEYDNRHVVPYNPLIMVMFQSHHNLEFCYGQSDNLKYALKYPFKGPSFSYIKCADSNKISIDEPAQYAKMLFRSPSEAYCRIQGNRYAYLSHTVIPLSIHLPGLQKIVFPPESKKIKLKPVTKGVLPETPLTSYWKLWRTDQSVQNILFENMPETYSIDPKFKTWKKRNLSTNERRIQDRKPVFGRIYPVSPRENEKFALYVLMRHFPGDPDHLKNVNGTICDTFADAARLRGLFEDNAIWERTLSDASTSLMPSQMRQLFVNILLHGSTQDCIIDSKQLWEMFKDNMYDKRCTDAQKPSRIDRALAIIERYLFANGKQMKDYHLPLPTNSLSDDPNKAVDEFFFPQHVNDDDVDETVDTSFFESAKLNTEQNNFYKLVLDAVINQNSKQRLFFLSGDGGTGKTFLLNFILFNLRRLGNKILATASTGIAATKFYAGGMTLHSAFRFGITHELGKIPSIPFGSYFGRRIIESNLIIIDEITMIEKTVIENVDKLCRTMVPQNKNIPFAGKVVIISGDWKQSLPVVKNSPSPEAQVAVCLQSSNLYPLFNKTRLTQNMRLQPSEVQFKEWLYRLGTDTSGDKIAIPKAMIVETKEQLIEFVFDKGFDIPSSDMLKRLMLAPLNRSVDLNNSLVLSSFDTESIDYYSIDKCTNENPLSPYVADSDVAALNKLTPGGLPAHHIHLKVGSIIVLLRNLNTSKSLCNGTRLIVKKLQTNLISAETISGSNNGMTIGISRVCNSYIDESPDGISFERFQFPVREAFAMTITKAQGQTCERLGIDLTDEPFAHGQLYTALSRATNSKLIKVFAPNKLKDDEGNVLIHNVVARGLTFD
uniref:ATP-dependent DNA helicase n=3 Tax=Meloidogyne TaxID=189290 RepID=A0A914MFX3_MELIC